MAFGFLKNMFKSKTDNAKLSHIRALVATALADGKIDDTEKAILAMVVKREGITEQEFEDALGGKKIEYTIPDDEHTKELYIRDIAAIMVVDGKINPEELKLCLAAAHTFGFSHERASEIIAQVAAAAMSSGYDGDKLVSELK